MAKRIKIVTDSVADIPQELLAQWNIDIIPTFVNYGGQSYADDGLELDRGAFYNQIAHMSEVPTTAAPPPALAQEILERAIEGFDHIVAIHVPQAYSTTLNNVRLGAQSLGDRVTVLDGLSITMGLGQVVLVAAEVAARTGSVEAVRDAVARAQAHLNIYAVIATMTYLQRSGRVNPIVAAVGTMLQIKPILHVHDGIIEPIHRVRTFGRALDKLQELVRAQLPLDRLVVLHIQNQAGARNFLESLGEIAPTNTPIMEVGPTLGTHIGPGSVGVVTLRAGWQTLATK